MMHTGLVLAAACSVHRRGQLLINTEALKIHTRSHLKQLDFLGYNFSYAVKRNQLSVLLMPHAIPNKKVRR